MNLIDKYIEGLKNAYTTIGAEKEWESFASVWEGLSEEDEAKIRELYPEVPESLIALLKKVDGTYYRNYGNKQYCVYFLCTDVGNGEYPYYLFSSNNIVGESKYDYNKIFDYLFEDSKLPIGQRECECDERIKTDGTPLIWLCFSDCMNNGGTSKIYIDFTPSEKGTVGQVIRFLHDPDSLKVVADSFDEFILMIMDKGYPFINDETADTILDLMS